jgi:hypothetical protein
VTHFSNSKGEPSRELKCGPVRAADVISWFLDLGRGNALPDVGSGPCAEKGRRARGLLRSVKSQLRLQIVALTLSFVVAPSRGTEIVARFSFTKLLDASCTAVPVPFDAVNS